MAPVGERSKVMHGARAFDMIVTAEESLWLGRLLEDNPVPEGHVHNLLRVLLEELDSRYLALSFHISGKKWKKGQKPSYSGIAQRIVGGKYKTVWFEHVDVKGIGLVELLAKNYPGQELKVGILKDLCK